jgi:hypothetical protein
MSVVVVVAAVEIYSGRLFDASKSALPYFSFFSLVLRVRKSCLSSSVLM